MSDLISVTFSESRNEVCGIRDQKGGIGEPWDRDQQFFEGTGISPYHFCKIRNQNFSRFWNQGSVIFSTKMGSAI